MDYDFFIFLFIRMIFFMLCKVDIYFLFILGSLCVISDKLYIYFYRSNIEIVVVYFREGYFLDYYSS